MKKRDIHSYLSQMSSLVLSAFIYSIYFYKIHSQMSYIHLPVRKEKLKTLPYSDELNQQNITQAGHKEKLGRH